MNSLLAKTVQTHQRDWPQRFPYVVAAYNDTVHESTGFSPNYLMFGRDYWRPRWTSSWANRLMNPSSVNDYAEHLVGMLRDAYDEARAHLGKAAERSKRYYDYKSHPVAFAPGDVVWVYSPRRHVGRSSKWQSNYSGPFTVVRKINAVNYVVERGPRTTQRVVHVDKLKPYVAPGLGEPRAPVVAVD